jgi:phage gpG-like protein
VITLYLSGQGEVMARVRRLSERIPQEMRIGIERLTIRLQTIVRSEKLSGQVLKVKTGRLRNSIAREVFSAGAMVTGIVSSAVKYAKPHEYGFHGTVSVREHMRTVKQAFGRPIEPVRPRCVPTACA